MDNLEKEMTQKGMEPFRKDMNVMLGSSLNIEGTMEQIEKDLGYQREDPYGEDYVNFGVNWGYTSAQAESDLDPGMLIAMGVFLILVIFTGYLIIYNIFQISVTGDIRYYGLLKTIGVTPPAVEADHPSAGAAALRDRVPLGTGGRLAGGRSAGAGGDRPDQPGRDQQPGEQFSADLCDLRPVFCGDGSSFLRKTRPDGGKGLPGGSGEIYRGGQFFPKKKTV